MPTARFHLDRNAVVPLHAQIYDAFLTMIRKDELKTGDALPSEHELARELMVSRATVRKAFVQLGQDGFLVSQAGKGTFVGSRPSVRQVVVALLVIGFTEASHHKRQGAYGSLVRGVAEATSENEVLFNIFHFPIGSDLRTCLARIDARRFDGVLVRMWANVTDGDIESLTEYGLPYVVIKRRIPNRVINSVVIDDIQGGYLAVDHLIRLGHRRIGIITGPSDIHIFTDRLIGAEQAFAARGLRLDPSLVVSAPTTFDVDGFRCMDSVLALPNPPTAVFVSGDVMASGAYDAIRRHGIRIPQEISIIGFDDIEAAALFAPPLTTIRTSYVELGRVAAELLLDLIHGKQSLPTERIINPVLVVRESTTRCE
jgi:DNA-binding LacI/PurR family transcriptional regulator